MHELVLKPLKEWVESHRPEIDYYSVADLGGRNFNGCTKDLLPHAMAFDINPGDGVDVVIEKGVIPEEYAGRFPFVTATSVINFCEDEAEFVRELAALCQSKAHIFVCGCTVKCPYGHTHPNGAYRTYRKYDVVGDLPRLVNLFGLFYDVSVTDLGTDFILTGRRL